MKIKTISASSTALLLTAVMLSVAIVPNAHASNINADVNASINDDRDDHESASTSIRVESTTTVDRDSDDEHENEGRMSVRKNATSTATTTRDDDRGSSAGEAHRSIVSSFVHSLLSIAGREGGIGAKVSAIAQTQNDSASSTANAIAKVDGRGSVRTFFFGGDYRNLGVIRSEIATTTENIARLKALLSQTTTDADRAELSAQIQVLESEQVKIDTYVKAHESHFSLFGWFNKMFVK